MKNKKTDRWRRTRAGWPIFALMLFALASCDKKEDGTPALTAPEKAFTSTGHSFVPAEVEVKASSGPIELSLLLYKKQIKSGDSIWQQLRVRNVGDKEIIVADQIFHDPWQLGRQSPIFYADRGYGIYLDVFGPDGKRLMGRVIDDGNHRAHEVSGLLEVGGPEEQAMLDGWKKKGLTLFDINTKLIDFNTKKRRAKEENPSRPVIRLKPGEVAETKSWFYYGRLDKWRKKPVPHPIGEFARVEFLDFDKPGKYMVRAVYDRTPNEEIMKIERKHGYSPDIWEVLVRTPWVQVTVLP